MDDGGSNISWLLTVGILILCAMLFAMMETAFASVSRTRLKALADKGRSDAKKAINITDHFDRAITTLLICTNIVHIAAASVVTVNVTRIWGVSAVTLSTLITTLAVFFFGEMMPKSIARKYSERISLSMAGLLHFLMVILTPISAVLTWIGNAVSSLTKGDSDVSVTEDEIYDIIEDMTEQGTLDEDQGDLISSALMFQEVSAESILTSRVDLASLDVSMSQQEILDFIKSTNHSRLPVFEGTIDHIIGILQIRKYIRTYLLEGEIKDVRDLLDEVLFVHQSAKIADLFEEMTEKKLNVAVVTDNYGGTLGIVTIEDILEELVGEIWDEDDQVEENIVQIADDLYSVKASEHVIDVLDDLNIHYSDEEEQRITNKLMSELAFENFPQIPSEGDSFDYLNTRITVQIMKQNRIIRLKVKVNDVKKGEDEQ
ncbi:MAG: HlyC/CorC family transporter [Erysipelotrichaceae bacterium]|nr:HlyC/CorC family transporter [Erysipelotrichaceae bacterium]